MNQNQPNIESLWDYVDEETERKLLERQERAINFIEANRDKFFVTLYNTYPKLFSGFHLCDLKFVYVEQWDTVGVILNGCVLFQFQGKEDSSQTFINLMRYEPDGNIALKVLPIRSYSPRANTDKLSHAKALVNLYEQIQMDLHRKRGSL